MKNIALTCLAILSLFVLSCDNTEKKQTVTTNASFDQLVKNYYEDGLKLDPVAATMTGDERYNALYVNPLSIESMTNKKSHYQDYFNKINKLDLETLSPAQKMSQSILKWECEMHLNEMNFKNAEYFPIDQMWSQNLSFGQLASGMSAQPFKNTKDYKNWIKRVDGYLSWLSAAEANMRMGMKEGYVLPKSLIKKVIPQLKEMTVTDLNKHLFYTPVKNFPKDIKGNERNELTESYTRMIKERVIPTYKSIHDFMANEYLPSGRKSSGIDAIPDGAAYYQHQIKKYTTTTMTAEEIHQLGLSEVARILSEMEKIKNDIGFKGDLKAFFNDVRKNPKLMPYKTPEEIIANFNAIHEIMKPQLEALFNKKPKTPFEVRQTEAFRENSASAEYNPGSLDGTRPGIFYTPIPNAKKYNVYSDESLFLHEAIPGHHYQISLTQESTTLSDFRKTLWYSGYGEGWALYSESLGTELGLYTDPYQYFGMLGAEMHRAVRLVVDTGIHSKGWTREDAIKYSLENEAESEAGIISEIERYMANPGQALSYKIGQLKIIELRKRAELKLGDKFDIREYHNQVLETGCVPLALLEEKIDGWIAGMK